MTRSSRTRPAPDAHGVLTYRHLTTQAEFAEVVELERVIWGPGYDDVVPTPIFAITVHRGGVLIGAFDGPRMVAFVWGLASIKDGQAAHWSHMMGVLPAYRGHGVGLELKRLQRARVMELGLSIVEWTYDPLQAMNAHLNFARLGVVAHEYEENIYGASGSPLHQGNPTDRLVAEWHVRDERVETRLAGARPLAPVLIVEPLNAPTRHGRWLVPGAQHSDIDARLVSLTIPMGFTEMLAEAPTLALEWRMATRALFTAYLRRGYGVAEFFLDPEQGRGWYLLRRQST